MSMATSPTMTRPAERNKPTPSQAKNASAPLQSKLQRGFFIAKMEVCGIAAAREENSRPKQKQATESSTQGGSFLWQSLQPCSIGRYGGPFFHTWSGHAGVVGAHHGRPHGARSAPAAPYRSPIRHSVVRYRRELPDRRVKRGLRHDRDQPRKRGVQATEVGCLRHSCGTRREQPA